MKADSHIAERINYLSDKIRENRAKLSDYDEFIDIVDDFFDDEEIQRPLKLAGVESYAELMQKRDEASSYEEKRKIEVIALGALLALGLAAILTGLDVLNKD